MYKDQFRYLFDNVAHVFSEWPLELHDGRMRVMANRIPKNLEPFTRLDFELTFGYTLRLYVPGTAALPAQNIQCMVEELIEAADCRDRLLSRSTYEPEDKLSFLITRLFNSAGTEGLTYVASAGLSMGYDLTSPYYVCALHAADPKTGAYAPDYTMRSLLYLIRSFYKTSAQDLVTHLTGSRIIICRQLKGPESERRRQTIEYFSELSSLIANRLHISIRVGVGCATRSITDFSSGLIQAQAALKYARIFRSSETTNFYEDFSIEEEISHISSSQLKHFLEHYCEKLDEAPQLAEMLEALVTNNMDVTLAAKALFIHRNTAVYRLNQLKALLELNPLHSDSDRCTFITIYIYYRLSRRETDHSAK